MEKEFVFAIQTHPAVKGLVYLVGAVSAEDLADKAVHKEKTYSLNIPWFYVSASDIV